MEYLCLWVFVVVCVWTAQARYGVDLSVPLTASDWEALFPSNIPRKSSFALFHAVFYNNTINSNVLNSVINAWKAGIPDISLYLYPCMPQSQYAKANNIQCGTPASQINRLLRSLTSRNMYFKRHVPAPHYVNASYGSLNASTSFYHNLTRPGYRYDKAIPSYNTDTARNITLQTLYINVEDNTPNHYFSFSHHENVRFLADMVKYAESRGIEVGIYTSYRDWKVILTDRVNQEDVYYIDHNEHYLKSNPFARLKLWTARYDGLQTLDKMEPFMDWKEIYIKQMTGGATSLRRIGTPRVCTDFIPDSYFATTTV